MMNTDATPQPAATPELAPEERDAASGTLGFPNDRRKRNIPVAKDRRASNAAEKRRTSERRRLIDPTTCERDYNDEETEFMKAMDRYKRENRRPFPTWSEVLEVMCCRVSPRRRTDCLFRAKARRGNGGGAQ